MAAILAELEPGKLYFFEGDDLTTEDLAKRLLLIVAEHEASGAPAAPIRFSRSHASAETAEFSIVKRDDATVYIVTDDAVVEAGPDAHAIAEALGEESGPNEAPSALTLVLV